MVHDIIFLILGIALIIFGGDWVTDGAEAIARRFNVTPLVIGLTVVAFGSSTPDLVVSVVSTLEGKSQLAIGGVVGAVIFDALLVVGVTALIKPVVTSRSMRVIDLPMMALAALILLFCGADKLIDGSAADVINRSDGLIMLCVFALFMAYTLLDARHSQAHAKASASTASSTAQPTVKPAMKMWAASGMVIVGLAALVIGGRWIVSGASGVAKAAGMSEALIGLTIVAVGSSLPDLATSVIAALKGQAGIALGNVVGSCVIDILFVLGTCATIAPLKAGTISNFDFITLAVAALAVWAFGTLGRRTYTRLMGTILVLAYIVYTICLVVRG